MSDHDRPDWPVLNLPSGILGIFDDDDPVPPTPDRIAALAGAINRGPMLPGYRVVGEPVLRKLVDGAFEVTWLVEPTEEQAR